MAAVVELQQLLNDFEPDRLLERMKARVQELLDSIQDRISVMEKQSWLQPQEHTALSCLKLLRDSLRGLNIDVESLALNTCSKEPKYEQTAAVDDELNDRLLAEEAKTRLLTEENERLQQQADTNRQCIVTLEETAHENERLQQQLKDLEDRYSEVSRSFEYLKARHSITKERNQSLELQLREMETHTSELEEENQSMRQQLEEVKIHCLNVEDEKQSLQQQLAETQSSCIDQQELKGQHESLRRQLEELETVYAKERQNNQSLNSQITELTTCYTKEKELNMSLNEQIAELETRCLDEKSKADSLRQQLTADSSEDSQQFELLNAATEENRALNQRLTELEKRCSLLTEENQRLQDANQQTEELTAEQKEKVESALALSNKEIEELREQCASLRDKHAADLQQQLTETNRLKEQLEESQQENEKLQEALLVQIDALTAPMDTQQQLNELQERYEEAQRHITQLQEENRDKELAVQDTKLRKLRHANAQLKAKLEEEQATNRHNMQAFEEHKQAVAELYEKLRLSEQEHDENKNKLSQLRKDNKRFKRLIKQLTERLKQCRQELEEATQAGNEQVSEKQKEVNSLQSRLDRQIEVAQASSDRLASLSLSACIHTTLQLLSAGAVSVKPAQGQRPVFFPLIRHTETEAAALTTQQLYYNVNLLHALSLEMLCQNSNRLSESGGVCHYLITYKPATPKTTASSGYFSSSRLLLALYVLSVQPLLQQLSDCAQQLLTEDRDYLLLQLDSLLYKLRQPTIRLQQKMLYLTESKQEGAGCGTLELSSLSLLNFLSKLTEELRDSNFIGYLQPEAAAKRISECISSSSSSWFTECLHKTAAAVLRDVSDADEKYPNLYAARCGLFETDKKEIIGQIQTQLQCLHDAAVKSNVAIWNSMCYKLNAMCKNRDVSFIDQQQLISIIQTAKRNTLLNTQILEVIQSRLTKQS